MPVLKSLLLVDAIVFPNEELSDTQNRQKLNGFQYPKYTFLHRECETVSNQYCASQQAFTALLINLSGK